MLDSCLHDVSAASARRLFRSLRAMRVNRLGYLAGVCRYRRLSGLRCLRPCWRNLLPEKLDASGTDECVFSLLVISLLLAIACPTRHIGVAISVASAFQAKRNGADLRLPGDGGIGTSFVLGAPTRADL